MKRVMVVDDNIVILKQTQLQLSQNYETITVLSGQAALKAASRRRPDVFLLDVEMPGMDGFELLDRIKTQPHLSGIPVIFYSSLTDSRIQVRALKAGARDYIVKPAVRDVLVHRIELQLQMASCLNRMEETVTALSGVMTESFSELINFRYKMQGHSGRVPKLCATLGRELLRRNTFNGELSVEDLSHIIKASPLHDIGNITIPDRILLKPGPLTGEEREQMNKHSERGAEILGRFFYRVPSQRFLHYAKLIALTHHEAWDGSGYPAGLREDAIPLCGRLTAVADVYDDITSDRVYRKRLNHDEACRAVLAESGKRFDPRIVDAFEAVADELQKTAA